MVPSVDRTKRAQKLCTSRNLRTADLCAQLSASFAVVHAPVRRDIHPILEVVNHTGPFLITFSIGMNSLTVRPPLTRISGLRISGSGAL